jgi:UDP-N-acetylglucosamine:LPS N-acetylglucosamine transferase
MKSLVKTGTAHRRGKVLAVASGGGHWVQLLRLLPAFADMDVVFVTVDKLYREQVVGSKLYVVRDATRWNKFGLVLMAGQLVWVMLRERPTAVVSTGAAPGFVAVVLGWLIGARTMWLDSIANLECLSLSGTHAGRFADLWLTQWPHLTQAEGPHYAGSVL